MDTPGKDNDIEKPDGLMEKVESTVADLIQSFLGYLRTVWLIGHPFLYQRLLRILNRPGSRVRYLPPLVFLSISSFLLAVPLNFLRSDKVSLDPEDWLRWIKENVSPEVSITSAIFTALPIFALVVITAYLWSWLLLKDAKGRQRFFNFTCYVFGFFCSTWFLVFVLANVLNLAEKKTSISTPWVFEVIRETLVVLFLAVLFRAVSLLGVGAFCLSRRQNRIKRSLKVLVVVVTFPVLAAGCFLIQTIPGGINSILAPAPPVPRFHNLPTSVGDLATVGCNANGDKEILFNVLVQNTTKSPILIKREFGSLYLKPNDQQAPDQISSQLVVGSSPDEKMSVLIIKPDEASVLACTAVVPKSDYQRIAGRQIHFSTWVIWWEAGSQIDSGKGGEIIDQMGNSLTFPTIKDLKCGP